MARRSREARFHFEGKDAHMKIQALLSLLYSLLYIMCTIYYTLLECLQFTIHNVYNLLYFTSSIRVVIFIDSQERDEYMARRSREAQFHFEGKDAPMQITSKDEYHYHEYY